jgi:hydroxymethylpyrimidine pyrophosphatase-like HAD family hydrolase
MKKILFACDLDNTLLYSFNHKQNGDSCVELLQGKEQGYMSKGCLEMIKKIKEDTIFVPVTTRSIEQYKRIKWDKSAEPNFAITTNGGILLVNGSIDSEWHKESLKLCEPYLDELSRMYELLKVDTRFTRCRIVDNFILFTTCGEGVDAQEVEKEYSPLCSLTVLASGRKLYFFPAPFNKADAVRRFLRRYHAETIVSAGDSVIDVPMLSFADYALVPNEEIATLCKNTHASICPENMRFSDFALASLIDLIKDQQNKI